MCINMQIKFKLLGALLFIYSLFLFNTRLASAKVDVQKNGTINYASDRVVDDDLFLAADTVEIAGVVNGDVFVGAGTFRLTGTVNGNLHVGAGVVNISGVVSGNVYVGGGNVSIENARIEGSVLVGAGNVNIDKDSEVLGSLLVGAGTLSASPVIERNVMAAGGSINLNAEIGGEARLAGGVINIGPDTKIEKDLYYDVSDSSKDLNLSEGATVSGMTKRVTRMVNTSEQLDNIKENFASGLRKLSYIGKLISLLGALLVGYLSLKYLSKPLKEVTNSVESAFLRNTLTGFLVCLVSVPLFVLLFVTGVGASLAGVLILLLLLGLYFSKLVSGLALGNWLSKRFDWKLSIFASFSLGLLAIYVLRMIPFLGFFVSLITTWVGLGALFNYFKIKLQDGKVK